MTVVAKKSRRLQFAFYTNTYMYRSEIAFYRQALGMRGADVHVLARWGNLLDEFPVPSLSLIDEYRSLGPRLKTALLRRMDRSGEAIARLPDYAVKRASDWMDSRPIDLVYCRHGWNAAQLQDVMERVPCNLPFVFQVCGSDINGADSLGNEYKSRLKRSFARAELILGVSDFLCERAIAIGAPPSKVERHYAGIRIPSMPKKRGILKDSDNVRLLAVSRITEVKGVPHAIRAFAQALQSVPNLALEIIGEGRDMEKCKCLANELGVADRVKFLGSQSISEVYRRMAQADLFIQHNIRSSNGQEEAFGLSIAEASAHGVPVVATRSGGISEVVIDGQTGVLVAPGDEHAMSSAIVDLALDAKVRRRMGSAGRAWVEESFDIKKQNEKLEAILTQVVIEHKARGG